MAQSIRITPLIESHDSRVHTVDFSWLTPEPDL